MASPKTMKKFRSWSSMDSEDPNDIRRLYSPERPPTKPRGKFVSTWTFSLVSLGFAVLFLFGLFVGYYVRESQSMVTEYPCTDYRERPDKLNENQLRNIHENVMYYLSAERIQKLVGELSADTEGYSTGSVWDKAVTEKVKSKLEHGGIKKVEIDSYDVVVTYPDPQHPNRLEVISATGNLLLNVSIGNSVNALPRDRSKVNETARELRSYQPYVAFSPKGFVEGELVYGNYGRKIDLEIIRKEGIQLKDRILLLRLGQTTVYEKVYLASKYGVIGVLLYQDPADVYTGQRIDPSSVPFASAREYGNFRQRISIPVQTVSMVTAERLLKNITGILSPITWHGGFNITYNIGDEKPGSWKVRLVVNNKQKVQQIQNVIGTLPGSIETDRYVMVGVSRNFFTTTNQSNPAVGTALLLEMAQSLSSIIELEDWKPRRGIKFFSWGGSELSNTGLIEYLKVNHHLIQSRAVAYIDLDLYLTSGESSTLEIRSSALLSELINKVGLQVPDPVIHDQSVAEAWKGTILYSQNDFFDNRGVFPIMQQLGIPVLKAGYSSNDKDLQISMATDDVQHDAAHHYKYHLTAARVMSLVISKLADDLFLNHNVEHYTHFIYSVVKNTAQILHKVNKYHLADSLLSSAIKLQKTGQAFQEYSKSIAKLNNLLKIRKINDIKLLLEKMFTCRSQTWCPQEIVSSNGTWSSIVDAVCVGQVIDDWSAVEDQTKLLQLSLDEATRTLHLN